MSFGSDMYLRVWDVRTGKAQLEYRLRPTGVLIPVEDSEPDAFEEFGIDQAGILVRWKATRSGS